MDKGLGALLFTITVILATIAISCYIVKDKPKDEDD